MITPSGDLTTEEVRVMRSLVLDTKLLNTDAAADQAAHALLSCLDLWEIVKNQPHRTSTARACRCLCAVIRNYSNVDKQDRKQYAICEGSK